MALQSAVLERARCIIVIKKITIYPWYVKQKVMVLVTIYLRYKELSQMSFWKIRYVLMGLPGQTLEEVVSRVLFVTKCGIKTKLARFSPISGIREWERAVEAYGFDPRTDPLLHNNSIHVQLSILADQGSQDEFLGP